MDFSKKMKNIMQHADKKVRSVLPNISPIEYLVQGFNFIVSLNEFTYGFKNVSGMSIRKEVDYIKEGGVNDHLLIVGRPSDDRPELTFSRGLMLRSPSIYNKVARAAAARMPNDLARKTALIAANALDPQECLETGPALGTIRVYDRYQNLIANYSFLSLGMREWKLSDLDAQNGDILIEEFTVMHTGLVREPLNVMPSVANEIIETISDFKTSQNAKSSEEKEREIQERRKKAEEAKKAKEKEIKEFLEKQKEIKKQLDEKREKRKKLEEELKKALEERNKEALEERKSLDEERAKAREEAEKAKDAKAEENAKALEERKSLDEERAKAREEAEKAKDAKAEENAKALEERKSLDEERAKVREEAEKAKDAKEKENKEFLEARKELDAQRAEARKKQRKQKIITKNQKFGKKL